jgi:hypothetical protein
MDVYLLYKIKDLHGTIKIYKNIIMLPYLILDPHLRKAGPLQKLG